MDKIELGKKLRELRTNVNMSIIEVAELTGIDRRTISRIEKGEIFARFADVEAIANATRKFIYFEDEKLPEITKNIASVLYQLWQRCGDSFDFRDYISEVYGIKLKDEQLANAWEMVMNYGSEVDGCDERRFNIATTEWAKKIADYLMQVKK